MLSQLRPAIVLFVLFTLLTGVVYPFAITGIGQALFRHQANGSLLEKDGKVIGSRLIGQSFTADKYFHGRPSATTDTDPSDSTKTVPSPYNAANSGGSNLGPTSKSLIDRIKTDTDKLKAENPNVAVPVDLVTTSASGLDPDISPAAAFFQSPRVAKARGLSNDALNQLIAEHTEPRWLGIIGEPVVNVLELNLALDATVPAAPAAVKAPEAATSAKVVETATPAATTPTPVAQVAAPAPPAAAEPARPSASRHKHRRHSALNPVMPAPGAAPAADESSETP